MSSAFDWRAKAACRDKDPELFFPVGNTGAAYQQIEEAKAVCRTCKVIDACLKCALDTNQDYGVWGGKQGRLRRASDEPRCERDLAAHRIDIACRCTAECRHLFGIVAERRTGHCRTEVDGTTIAKQLA